MRKVAGCGSVLLLVLSAIVYFAGNHFPAYRHLRVAQTKVVAGAPMTIDDIWWTQSSHSNSFLRILCHWSDDGFPPRDYNVRAIRLNPDGSEIKGEMTWYVPMPKTLFTPKGVTPFFWEFKTAPPTGKYVDFRIRYKSISDRGGIIFGDEPDLVDFRLPNVALQRDMSCPDFFAPKSATASFGWIDSPFSYEK
jgi:hypothetical protein